jgi:hypothetical protein
MNQMSVTTFSVKTDEEAIKNVLYGGHPWIVMCKNESDTTEIWSPFMDAARELGSTAKAAVIDCYAPLPQSGKTLAEKFKFQQNYKWDPLLFLCANGDRPKQVPRDVYHSEGGLVGYVTTESAPTLHRISNDKQLTTFCTKRKSCVMVYRKDKLTADEKVAIDGLMEMNRATSFVAVNSRKLRLSLEPKFEGIDEPVVLLFKKISKPAPPPTPKMEVEEKDNNEPVDIDSLMDNLLDDEDSKENKDAESEDSSDVVSGDEEWQGSGPRPGLYAKLYRGKGLDVTAISDFIQDFLLEEDLDPLPKAPSMKARPKEAKPKVTPSPTIPKRERKPREPPREQTREEREQQLNAERDAEKNAKKEQFRTSQKGKERPPESEGYAFETVEEGVTTETIGDDDEYDDDEVLDLD